MAVGDARVVCVEMKPWEGEFIQEQTRGQSLDLRVYAGTADELPEDEMAGAQVLSCFIRSRVDAELLARFPALRLVVTRSTGYDHVDLAACAAKGVTVCYVPQYGENTVAEHTFGLILALSRNIYQAVDRVKRGNLSIEGLRGFDLYGKTLGVIGAGGIGLHVIRIGRALNMRVLAYDTRPQPLIAEVLGFQYAGLEALLQASDVVSIHVPLLPATRHLLDAEKLALMKPTAILVNTSRGAIVDSNALLAALNEDRLAGAALDVLEGEEVVSEDRVMAQGEQFSLDELRLAVEAYRLMHNSKVIVTPHIAFYSVEALQRILTTTVDNVVAFLAGRPQNVATAA
jgi:D-lactate dehydrogenase